MEEWERRIREGFPKGLPYKVSATKYDQALKLLRKAGAGNPSPAPSPSPWPTVPSKTRGKNGFYFYNLYEIELVIELAKQYNLWVGVLVNETDLTPWQDGRRPTDAVWEEARKLKQAGLTVVATGWAEPFGDLDAQASFIGQMVHANGEQLYDEYMLNIEAGWVWEAGLEAFLKSDAFAPKLRAALGPSIPLSLAPDWGNNIHWLPWLKAGMSAARYQCYMNQWPHKNPKQALELLGRAQSDLPGGVPVSMREVIYGRYGEGSQNVPLATWTQQDDEAGCPPRSVWAAEFSVNAGDASWLAR